LNEDANEQKKSEEKIFMGMLGKSIPSINY